MTATQLISGPRTHLIALPVLVVLIAVPLWIIDGAVSALAVLAVGFFSSVSVWTLSHQVARAREQKCFLDEQLIQSQKLASIGELSAGIAHEINNPLAIIAQEIEWARYQVQDEKNDTKSFGELKDSLREIANQMERCREITHKLLDFARKKEPLIQAADINKIIEDMARLVEREATQKGIGIARNYRKDLPPVLTDPPLLRQVLLNLLNNAAYAIGRDGTISIKTRIPENGWIEIVISDTGCGIQEKDLTKIFDPFFTTKPPGKGTGLGLSICHGIIVRLGGRITVESEPGKGAVFAVRLPFLFTSQGKESAI